MIIVIVGLIVILVVLLTVALVLYYNSGVTQTVIQTPTPVPPTTIYSPSASYTPSTISPITIPPSTVIPATTYPTVMNTQPVTTTTTTTNPLPPPPPVIKTVTIDPRTARQTVIADCGDPSKQRGWYDVSRYNVYNDYCRFIKDASGVPYFSCAMAGTTVQTTPSTAKYASAYNETHQPLVQGDMCYGK